MTYFEYHNTKADSFARRMYGVSYETLGSVAQMDVDDAIASEWLFIEHGDY